MLVWVPFFKYVSVLYLFQYNLIIASVLGINNTQYTVIKSSKNMHANMMDLEYEIILCFRKDTWPTDFFLIS